jgi:hypothetical protein
MRCERAKGRREGIEFLTIFGNIGYRRRGSLPRSSAAEGQREFCDLLAEGEALNRTSCASRAA